MAGLQLALAIDDAPIAAAATQAVYNALTPLLRPNRRTIFVLQPLCACLEALRLLGPKRLTCIRRAPHLLACVGFELTTLATNWSLDRLAQHAAALDVAGFASEYEAACAERGLADEADAKADKLVGTLYAEFVASQPNLAEHGAPVAEGDEGGALGVKLWSALAKAEEATWAVLADAEGHPRVLEFTVQACRHILQATPTSAKAEEVHTKLSEILASAAEAGRYKPIAELIEPLPEEEPLAEEEDAEAANARKVARAEAMLARQLKGIRLRKLDRREKREMHRRQRPWRAQAKLLLARCAALIPPPAPAEKDKDPDADDDDDDDDDDDTPPPPPEGSAVIAELSRAAVLAIRADCPALLLSTVAQLRNTFDELPAYADTTFAYRCFQPMPRLSQADDKDPPADIPRELWKPLLRASEALLTLITNVRDGGSIGGRDPFAMAIAAKDSSSEAIEKHAPRVAFAERLGDDDDMSTHVKGPQRWFETRSTSEDAITLDFDWIASFIELTLRQLQMARQWTWQQYVALTFDDLTEGHYGASLMPFLEQAQQKIGASKWCDGEPLPQVKRRVDEIARDQSACLQAIEGCRRAMHALQTRAGGLSDPLGLRDGEEAHQAAIQSTIKAWQECAAMCRSRRETAMVIESLSSLGSLQLADGKSFKAAESWNAALDAIFTTQEVCKHWAPFFVKGAAPIVQKVPLFECSRALGLLGSLARHTTPHRLERRLQLSLFASNLISAITSLSVVNPSRLVDWAGFRLTELPMGMRFDKGVLEDMELLAGLHAMAATLIAYELPLRALPVLAVLKYLSTDIARDATHSVAADALTIDALTQLGQIDHATNLLTAALAAHDLPNNALQLPAPPPEDADAPPKPPLAPKPTSPAFLVHLAPESEANGPAVRHLLDAQPAPHLASLASQPVVQLLQLARARILLKITERVPPSAIAAIAAEAGGAAADAAAPVDPKAKGGKADPKKGEPEPSAGGGVHAVEILRAVEALLDGVYTPPAPVDISADAEADAEGAPEEPSPAELAANFTLRCEAALLRSQLAARRGMLSHAIAPLHEAMGGAFPTLSWAGLDSDATGSVATQLFVLQPGALHWLRMRTVLATLCLQQGQLEAADVQIDTGRTETNNSHDKRMLRTLLLLHARVRVERGELPKAADEFKLWLDDASHGSEVDGYVVAVASMQYAAVLVSLAAGVGAPGGGQGAPKIVRLLRQAEEQLRAQAEAHGMLSTEMWPCLVQPTPGAMPGAGSGADGPSLVDATSLHNLYLRPLSTLVEAKLKLALGLQLTANVPGTMSSRAAVDAAAVLLTDAKKVAERTLHPRPNLTARVHHELGRALHRQAAREGNVWGGLGSVSEANAPPPEGDEPPPPPPVAPALVSGAAVALSSALRLLADGEQVDPTLQAQIIIELSVLHGACLVSGDDAKQKYLAAAYLSHACAASAARRQIIVELPGASPVAPLDPALPLPLPIEEEAKQAAGLAAMRPHTMPDSVDEGKSSRDLMSLASAFLRTREMPNMDQDGFERKLTLLHSHLRAACKPFADAISPPPPPPSELSFAAPPGTILFQWYEPSFLLAGAAIEPMITLVYAIAAPPAEAVEGGPPPPESPFLLGQRTLPRAAVRATSRLVQRMATASLGDETAPLLDSMRVVKELLLPPEATDPEGPPGSRPPTRGNDADPTQTPAFKYKTAVENVKDDGLAALAKLMDPDMGASVGDEPLCAWMQLLLTM